MTRKDYIQTFSTFFKLHNLKFNHDLIEQHLNSLFSQNDYSHNSIITSLQDLGIKTQFYKTQNLPVNKWIIALIQLNNKNIFINIKIEKNKDYVLFQPINKSLPIRIDYKDFKDSFQGLFFLFIKKENMLLLHFKKYFLHIFLPLSFLIYLNYTVEPIFFLLFVLSNLGFFFSLIIINETIKLSPNNFCQTTALKNNSFNCNSVLESKISTIYKHYKIEDISLISFFTLLNLSLINHTLLRLFPLLSLLFIPIIIVSLYLQKFILKKWCLYCLFIDLILLFYTSSFFLLNTESSISLTKPLLTFLILFILNSFLWYHIKPYIIKYQKNKKYTKIKNSYSYFKYSLINSPIIQNQNIDFPVLTFGELETNHFILIIKPNCTFCHQLIPFFLNLTNQYRIKLQFIFNIDMNNSNQITLASILSKNKVLFKEWSLNFNIPSYTNSNFKSNHDYILEHKKWCLNNDLDSFVPQIIYNNRLIPNEFDIPELKTFIKKLINNDQEIPSL